MQQGPGSMQCRSGIMPETIAESRAARLSRQAVRELDPAATHGYGIRWDPAARREHLEARVRGANWASRWN